jgi:DNA adenine methylase
VKKASADDFIYFDPPYHPLNATSSFTSYQASGFNTEDQEKLRDLYSKLAKRGCKVMLSNSDTDYIRGLYEGFNIHTVYAGRAINSVGGKRGKISEVVITNY